MNSPKPTLHERVAEAILERGSPDYARRSGAIQILLSDLAREGNLRGMSEAFRAYTLLIPDDAHRLAAAVPAMVLNQYLYLHEERPAGAMRAWLKESDDWSDSLSATIGDDDRFEALARAMSEQAKRLDR